MIYSVMTFTIESQLMAKSPTIIRQIVGDFVFRTISSAG